MAVLWQISINNTWVTLDEENLIFIEFKYTFCKRGDCLEITDSHLPAKVMVYPVDGWAIVHGEKYTLRRE